MRRFFLIFSGMLLCLTLSAQSKRVETAVENGVVDAVKKMMLGADLSSVRDDLLQLAAKDSTNDAVQFYLGICELSLGNRDASGKAFEKAVALDPSNDDYQEQLANVYAAEGRMDEARSIFLSLLDRKPGKYRSAYTLSLLAENYMFQRQDSLALANFDAALLYDPDYFPAYLGKAEVYRMKGNLAAFFSNVHLFVANPQANAYSKCNYLKELVDHVDGRTYQVWHAQLDSLVSCCVDTHPSDSSALKLAGRWFYGTGDKARGEKYFDDFLKFYPDCAEAHYIQLSLLNERENYAGMIEECGKLIAIAGDDGSQIVSALSTMGDCYQKTGDNTSAYSCYEKALKINPEYLPVLNNYSYFLSLEGKKLAKAQKMSRITVEKEPDNATYLDTYGWILHLRGKDREAKPYFKHAMLYGGKDNKEVLLHYSVVLEALGEKDLSSYYKGLAESK